MAKLRAYVADLTALTGWHPDQVARTSMRALDEVVASISKRHARATGKPFARAMTEEDHERAAAKERRLRELGIVN